MRVGSSWMGSACSIAQTTVRNKAEMKPCVVIEFLSASRRSASSLALLTISQPIFGAMMEPMIISTTTSATIGNHTVKARLWSYVLVLDGASFHASAPSKHGPTKISTQSTMFFIQTVGDTAVTLSLSMSYAFVNLGFMRERARAGILSLTPSHTSSSVSISRTSSARKASTQSLTSACPVGSLSDDATNSTTEGSISVDAIKTQQTSVTVRRKLGHSDSSAPVPGR